MEWIDHPIVVATYVAFLGLLITAIQRLSGLFHRVTKVEEGVQRLEDNVKDFGEDLKAHMAEESATALRLESLLVALAPETSSADR